MLTFPLVIILPSQSITLQLTVLAVESKLGKLFQIPYTWTDFSEFYRGLPSIELAYQNLSLSSGLCSCWWKCHHPERRVPILYWAIWKWLAPTAKVLVYSLSVQWKNRSKTRLVCEYQHKELSLIRWEFQRSMFHLQKFSWYGSLLFPQKCRWITGLAQLPSSR